MSEIRRILVIDDEGSIRESLRAFLEDYDFYVVATQSAEEALEILKDEPFDLAIVDMRLPGDSGDVFIGKAIQLCDRMQFVIHTGSVEFQLTDVLKNYGIKPEHVYLKPLNDLATLVQGVRKILNGKE